MAAKLNPKAEVEAAKAAMKAGDLAQAQARLEAVLARFPAHATARKLMARLARAGAAPARLDQAQIDQAVGLLRAGNPAGAEPLLRGLTRLAPGHAGLANLLGIALAQQEKVAESVKVFATAHRLAPQDAEIRGNLGGALLAAGKPAEALPHLEAAARATPPVVTAIKNLGDALHALRRSDEGLAAIDRALALAPDYVNAWQSKAIILRDLCFGDEALAAVEKALALAPQDLELRLLKAGIEAESDREEEAIATLRAILADHPDHGEARYRLGVLLSGLGQMDEAEATLRSVCTDLRRWAEPFRSLANIARLDAADPLVAAAIAAHDDPATPTAERMHLAFGLSKALWRADSARAWDYLHEGNRLRRAQFSYSTEETRREFGVIRKAFCAARMAPIAQARAEADGGGEEFIFILGMMRSGTTLLEDMLARHPAIAGAGERTILGMTLADRYDEWRASDMEFVAKLADRYRANLARHLARAPHVTDKMPGNFRFIGLIHAMFPRARILHMVRAPRDVLLSNYREYFVGGANKHVYDLRELAEYYLLYRELMEFWRAEFPGLVHDVVYEDLVADPEGQIRGVLDHLGLAFDPAVLDRSTARRLVLTASVAQVRQQIYSSSVGGWRAHAAQLAPMLEVLDAAGV